MNAITLHVQIYSIITTQ